MTAETLFHVASITKLYAAAVVLRLHERGALDIEQPMVGFLPEAITRGLHRDNGSDRTSEITIRQLLNHSSGLASYFEDRPKGAPSLAESLFREGDRAWTSEDMADRIREHLRPHVAPGRKIRYCDTIRVLIRVQTRATGNEMARSELRSGRSMSAGTAYRIRDVRNRFH